MSIDREAIYNALLALLQASLASSIVTIGRRHIMPPTLNAGQQPALFVHAVKEKRDPHPRGTGGKLTLQAELYLYCFEPGIDQTPGQETTLAETQINGILKSIDDALTPVQIGTALTLGGLVQHCWIDGDTLIDPGILTQQAAAVIPVSILVP